jgi:hypothetical protein
LKSGSLSNRKISAAGGLGIAIFKSAGGKGKIFFKFVLNLYPPPAYLEWFKEAKDVYIKYLMSDDLLASRDVLHKMFSLFKV